MMFIPVNAAISAVAGICAQSLIEERPVRVAVCLGLNVVLTVGQALKLSSESWKSRKD
jgi:hypothetical protein